ncbi:hypothetical protein ACHWUR_00440 [Klebsiella pneumoniae]
MKQLLSEKKPLDADPAHRRLPPALLGASADYLARTERQAGRGGLSRRRDRRLPRRPEETGRVARHPGGCSLPTNPTVLDGAPHASAWGFQPGTGTRNRRRCRRSRAASTARRPRRVRPRLFQLPRARRDFRALAVPRLRQRSRNDVLQPTACCATTTARTPSSECDFQQVCPAPTQRGASSPDEAEFLGRFSGAPGTAWSAKRAPPSSTTPVQQAGQLGQEFQFATHERIRLKPETHNDWTDNLIGAQYLEMPKNSR